MNKNSLIIVLIGILIFSVTVNILAFNEIERTHNEIQRLNEPKEDTLPTQKQFFFDGQGTIVMVYND